MASIVEQHLEVLRVFVGILGLARNERHRGVAELPEHLHGARQGFARATAPLRCRPRQLRHIEGSGWSLTPHRMSLRVRDLLCLMLGAGELVPLRSPCVISRKANLHRWRTAVSWSALSVASGGVRAGGEPGDQCFRCGTHLDLPLALIIFQECSQVGALRQRWVRRLHFGGNRLTLCAEHLANDAVNSARSCRREHLAHEADYAALFACFAIADWLSQSLHV